MLDRTLANCQAALREVDLHWCGRPLDEGVREAVEEIKRLRQIHIIAFLPVETEEIPVYINAYELQPEKGTPS